MTEKHYVYNTDIATVEYTTSCPATEKAGKCKLCGEIVDPWVGRRVFAAIHIHSVHLREKHGFTNTDNALEQFELY